ncbi:SAM-dependent methyltransferase [Plantactinospora sp. CA-290183]|uniref:SAM-dependent methyltransferase n=1 Tax=Plantactinospora sp. CA-290183 TaxID=3240006 RepID=UPI003D89CFE5
MSDDPAETPFVAGMYDYYLGGSANSPADRVAVDRIRAVLPEIPLVAWANRGFLQRAVTRMASEWGIKQFLDIGAGLPTQRNTHEVVGQVIPDGRVVYVDIDPKVIERGREMLAAVDNTAVIQGDVRQPDDILDHPQTRQLIDLDKPVGLLLVAVTQFIPDADDPWAIVRTYRDRIASGSYLALSAPTGDHQPERILEAIRSVYGKTPTAAKDRTRQEIARFFDGFDILPPYEGAEPVLTYVGQFGAEDPAAADDDASRWFYAAVGRKL